MQFVSSPSSNDNIFQKYNGTKARHTCTMAGSVCAKSEEWTHLALHRTLHPSRLQFIEDCVQLWGQQCKNNNLKTAPSTRQLSLLRVEGKKVARNSKNLHLRKDSSRSEASSNEVLSDLNDALAIKVVLKDSKHQISLGAA